MIQPPLSSLSNLTSIVFWSIQINPFPQRMLSFKQVTQDKTSKNKNKNKTKQNKQKQKEEEEEEENINSFPQGPRRLEPIKARLPRYHQLSLHGASIQTQW